MLFTIIRRNEKLAAKRSPMFDKNRFAKFLIYFHGSILGSAPLIYGGNAALSF